jgi:hypothetical protein
MRAFMLLQHTNTLHRPPPPLLCSSANPSTSPEQGRISMWVKIVTQWVIYAVFLWILVAPVLCPGRDFS